MSDLNKKAKQTISNTIEECGILDKEALSKLKPLRNKHGIKIISSHIPKDRKDINSWFNKFTIWSNNQKNW